MKENFVEITYEEYSHKPYENGDVRVDFIDTPLYFKPKEKFPIVFKGEYFGFEVPENGHIILINTEDTNWISHRLFDEDILALEKAIEKSKELRK